MKGRVSIRHLEGSALAGLEDEYSGPVVKIGTSAAAHVCFDADDHPGVAPFHAEIQLDPTGVRVLDTSGTAGVFVNGERTSGLTEIQNNDVLTLGDGGPGFRVSLRELPRTGASATVAGAFAPGGAARGAVPTAPPPAPRPMLTPASAVGGATQSGTPARSGSPAPTIVGARRSAMAPGEPPPVRITPRGNAPVPPSTGQVPPPWERHVANAGAAPPPRNGKAVNSIGGRTIGRSVGMNTLMGIVDGVTRRERRRSTVFIAVTSIVIIAASVAAALWMTPRAEAVRRWAPVVAELRPSVCLVMRRPPGSTGLERGFGTAWSVAPGIFATNAHVAEVFDELVEGARQEIIIRTPGTSPQDMRVTKILLHPGYGEWEAMLRKYNPYDPGRGDFMIQNTFSACDVALMYIEEVDHAKQPPPMRLATTVDGAHLVLGDEIATLGYPQENKIQTSLRPEPELRTSSLDKFANSFIESVEPKDANFLWYGWGTAGGASGSPVFNQRGEVIALLSAGDVVLAGGRRIPVGGTASGPDVRLLEELLDGRYEDAQRARSKEWESRFAELFARGTSHADHFSQTLAREVFEKKDVFDPAQQRLERLHRSTVNLEVRGGRGSVKVSNLPTSSGLNILVAVSRDRPTKLWSTFDVAHLPLPDELHANWDGHVVSFNRPGRTSATIQAANGSDDGTTEVIVYIYSVVSR